MYTFMYIIHIHTNMNNINSVNIIITITILLPITTSHFSRHGKLCILINSSLLVILFD